MYTKGKAVLLKYFWGTFEANDTSSFSECLPDFADAANKQNLRRTKLYHVYRSIGENYTVLLYSENNRRIFHL